MSPASSTSTPAALDGSSTLGQTLRSAREAHGVSLEEVAATLRIKASYLAALEVGQFEQLPGTAYALGFVRTYAEYLGLNGPDAVQRFKTESTGGQGPRSTLTFPSPPPRGRVPGMGPLVIAIIAAAVIIGAWFLWRSEAQNLLSRVPEVPERLLALVQSVTGTSEPAPPTQTAANTSPSAPILPPTVVPSSPTAGGTIALPPSVTAAPTPPPAAPTAVQAPPVPPQPPLPAVAEPVRHLAPIPPPQVAVQAPEDQPPPPPEDTVAGPTVAAATSPTPPPVAAPPTDGRVFGAVNDTVRVIIRSKGESWVQVRDADNQAVMTRVLRAGDQYRVPNRAGLTLMTGNAGALEVTVDGQPAPALGPTGMVRRAVPLDPDRLKQGTLE
ncbi:MAG: RodZ domain-containing protein [Elstera sp.]